jgi:hypothetical protein
MTEFTKENKNISAYQKLSGILTELKTEKISLNDAMHKIQLKDEIPQRPYCKVTSSGALALYGIKKDPIVMYADQWNRLLKVTKSPYIETYMKYNSSKLKYKVKNNYNKNNQSTDNLISENSVDNI